MLEIRSVNRLRRDAAAAPNRRLTIIGPKVNGRKISTPAPPLLWPKSRTTARTKSAAEVIQNGWRRRLRTSGICRTCRSPKHGCFGSGTVHAKVFIYDCLARPRRGWKPEFKLERYPPLVGASCSSVVLLDSRGVKDGRASVILYSYPVERIAGL